MCGMCPRLDPQEVSQTSGSCLKVKNGINEIPVLSECLDRGLAVALGLCHDDFNIFPIQSPVPCSRQVRLGLPVGLGGARLDYSVGHSVGQSRGAKRGHRD